MISTQFRKINNKIVKCESSGHLAHLYDNFDLSFFDLERIITNVIQCNIADSTEKLDGINLAFTWNNGLRVARSGSDIKAGGLDAKALHAKFENRPHLQYAFDAAFCVLETGFRHFNSDILYDFFKNGTYWLSAEIICDKARNVINYGRNCVIVHKYPVFVYENDCLYREDSAPYLNFDISNSKVANIIPDWHIQKPIRHLPASVAPGVYDQILKKLDCIRSDANLKYASFTIADYLRARLDVVIRNAGITDKHAIHCIANRIIGKHGKQGLPYIKTLLTSSQYQIAKTLVEQDKTLLSSAIEPLEMLIYKFEKLVLQKEYSYLQNKRYEHVEDLRRKVIDAITTIRASNNERHKQLLDKHLKKLGGVEQITTTMEGIVFVDRGIMYKLTGTFAPVNQILGILKYDNR